MSRPLLRVPLQALRTGEVELDGAAWHYVARVHRLQPGDRFVAFDPEEAIEADAELLVTTRHGARCRLGPLRPAALRPSRSVTLIQGIGKSDKPDRLVREATALGATRVIFVESLRTVVRLGDRADRRFVRWRKIAVEAARQSGRGDLPEIQGPLSLDGALAVVESASVSVCLDPSSEEPLGRVLGVAPATAAITVLVGPEGGFSEEELRAAQSAGFVRANLGPFVLRTETAATAALGAIVAGW